MRSYPSGVRMRSAKVSPEEITRGSATGSLDTTGSSDAAAVLRALDRLYSHPVGRAGLFEIADEVGSDIAFCLEGGTSLATGRGGQLEELPPLPDCFIAVCKPSFSLSTPEMYRRVDSVRRILHPDTDGIIKALGNADLRGVSRRMYNVFEDIGGREFGTVREIKSVLLGEGASGAVMTGSGSAVFGIFENRSEAEAALKRLASEYPFTYLARPVGRYF